MDLMDGEGADLCPVSRRRDVDGGGGRESLGGSCLWVDRSGVGWERVREVATNIYR